MSTRISSRTPEGTPGRCPVCRKWYRVERSPAGDATCPRCGSLVWPRAAARPSLVEADLRRFAAALRKLRRVPGWAWGSALNALTLVPRGRVAVQVERLAVRLSAEEGEDPAALTYRQIAEKLAGGGLTAVMIEVIVDAYAEWRELEAARARLGWWGRLKRRVVGPPVVLAH